ncbi:MAG: tRNA (adenosine(37)-N6)-dimethylallyltransferase MiaA [Clostridia bacterium]|nr:tRNA (adenosine(37)-N6)-dimethylallyltransferase MiaA [Clostridia bacterium]
MNEKIKVYAVVGATASGKSSLALELAQRYGGEIISCDSMQVYKKMNIGTAKPTKDELSLIRHHMIDIAEPDENFSCAEYVSLADAAIRDCAARGKLPIICGGTGLYLDALLREADFADDINDDSVRAALMELAKDKGADALHAELARIDPESAAAIHPNNVKRVARAIEIYRVGGITKSELDRRSREQGTRFDLSAVELFYSDRDILYRRIEKRVDEMIDMGLVEETRELMAQGVFDKNTTAAQAIGYKELFGYLEGRESLREATDTLKTATRRYAKRQMTWFGAKDYITRTDVAGKTFENIVNIVSEHFFS